jgi:hypothetical protein
MTPASRLAVIINGQQIPRIRAPDLGGGILHMNLELPVGGIHINFGYLPLLTKI